MPASSVDYRLPQIQEKVVEGLSTIMNGASGAEENAVTLPELEMTIISDPDVKKFFAPQYVNL